MSAMYEKTHHTVKGPDGARADVTSMNNLVTGNFTVSVCIYKDSRLQIMKDRTFIAPRTYDEAIVRRDAFIQELLTAES